VRRALVDAALRDAMAEQARTIPRLRRALRRKGIDPDDVCRPAQPGPARGSTAPLADGAPRGGARPLLSGRRRGALGRLELPRRDRVFFGLRP
jgi:hypothetical protein